MKYRYILYNIIAFFTLTASLLSCQNEDIAGSDLTPVPEGDEAYVSVTINTGDIQTLTKNETEGTVSDRLITNVRMVLYDDSPTAGNDPVVKYAFDFDIGVSEFWDGNYNAGWIEDQSNSSGLPHLYEGKIGKAEFVTYARKVVSQDYKMLIIINGRNTNPGDIATRGPYDAELINRTEPGQLLSAFTEECYVNINEYNGRLSGGSNFGGIIMTNHQGLIGVKASSDLKISADEANLNPVPVSVDRMVAKVSVDFASTFSLPPNLVFKGWGIVNINQMIYWMRVMLPGEAVPQSGMANLYAVDPNYSGISGDPDKIYDNFQHITYDDYMYRASAPTGREDESYIYVTENTMAANEQFKDVATQVVLSFQYTPEGMQQDDNYYLYKSKYVISATEILAYKAAPDESSIPSYLAGIKAAITAAEDWGYSFTNNYYWSGWRYGDITFCRGGLIFYTVPIRHFDVNPGELGYYGVVRNNIYDITINSVIPPGPGGPYISAGVNVLPWSKHTQTENPGEIVDTESYITYKYYYGDRSDNSVLFATEINSDVQAGDAIPLTAQILNAKKSAIPDIHDEYADGIAYSVPNPQTVDVINSANTVEIHYYRKGLSSIKAQPTTITAGSTMIFTTGSYILAPGETVKSFGSEYEISGSTYNGAPVPVTPGSDQLSDVVTTPSLPRNTIVRYRYILYVNESDAPIYSDWVQVTVIGLA